MPTASFNGNSPQEKSETAFGMAVSLIFWMLLLAACGLFALVSLSPKLLVYLTLRSQFERNQRRLVELEFQAEQLQRVVDAIRNDTDFASELTRIEFDAVLPDEEVIPVDTALKLDARPANVALPPDDALKEWYEPFVRTFATDEQLRIRLLVSASLLVIFSFAGLQPSRADSISTASDSRKSFWQSLVQRYARQA